MEILEWCAAMYGVSQAMPQKELEHLAAWEAKYVTGDGNYGTWDWPGWEKYIGKRPISNSPKAGYIYLAIREDKLGFKIGLSNDPSRRMAQLQATMVYYFPTDDMNDAESKLHRFFDSKRIRGEWFNLESEDLNKFRAIKKYQSGKFHLTYSYGA